MQNHDKANHLKALTSFIGQGVEGVYANLDFVSLGHGVEENGVVRIDPSTDLFRKLPELRNCDVNALELQELLFPGRSGHTLRVGLTNKFAVGAEIIPIDDLDFEGYKILHEGELWANLSANAFFEKIPGKQLSDVLIDDQDSHKLWGMTLDFEGYRVRIDGYIYTIIATRPDERFPWNSHVEYNTSIKPNG